MDRAEVVERRLRAETAVTDELDAGLAGALDRGDPGPGSQGTGPPTANVIHTAEGARDFGYEGALVAGVLLFGWTVPAVVDALGTEWLGAGWADVSFRRPVYTGADLSVRIEARGRAEDSPDPVAGLTVSKDGEVCVDGEVGTGRAAWAVEIADLPPREPDPAVEIKPPLVLGAEDVDLRTLDASVDVRTARAFGRSQPEPLAVFCDDRPLVHPAVLARQMISLLGHTYDYGRPSIHVSTRLQNLAPVPAGEPLRLSGRLVRTYERKGHHYAVTDGVLHGAGPEPLARLRHTNIFRVARRQPQ